ncbi:MAG: SpoIID/LytB domain-containing protein [Candidatus Levybacteria bacterium]|nr:SpoIID/LytB domain-containing protein [Candidatus Levybacteria bacterium]
MKKIVSLSLLFLLFIFSNLALPQKTLSDELDDISKQIQDLTNELNSSIKATKPLESELNNLKNQISGIKNRLSSIENDIIVKEKNINDGYKNLAKQEETLAKAISDYYIKTYYNSPFWIFLSASSVTDVTQILAYQKQAVDQDKAIITNIVISIQSLEEKKKNLESERVKLSSLKASLDEQSGKLDKIVSGAKAYQSTLSSKIAQLSAQQQQLIAQKLGSLNIPRSAGTAAPACVDDRDIDPGFSPRLAFFTYGVPNRTGLNQYGANGRAKAGQSVEQILNAYFTNFELKKDYDSGITINVEGYGGYNIEEYVKRIYEMPESWEMEALKAQAIAARSYALAYTNNGSGSICTTEKCQVFKPDPKGGRWDQAVNETRGWVITQGGSPVKAWYSSTHGGYVLSTSELKGWQSTSWTKHAVDTPSGSVNGFSDLNSNAYDKDSPWFYCDWGSRASYNKTAWLKPSEVADIVNTILLARADSSTKDHLYQTDKPHPYGGEVWNEERVKQELRSRNITPFNSVSEVSVGADFGTGKTNSVNISGDTGGTSFDGSEFKDWFNLRAPANIQIVGPLFNIEQK